ncbi:hypothetical protein NQ314_017459 [Rhamnusium bicolor]|uniref:Phosphatidylinositol-glycan biosynthesis class X protein n=1 Tax=Rhamnusium bicolor TaxID=1586634 RepID=A0AAV8WUU7_9CUCU|nr:hypothetical protein NQ314_017459 [Rhamnusium bicolor]
MITPIFLLLIVVMQDHRINGDTECLKLDVSITQKVENEGFHREIRWLIETLSPSKEIWINSGCKLCLRLVVSPDVEAPAHEATEHTVYIYLNNTSIDRISINLPVHLRYQRSQITGGYGKVPLQKPSLLTWCPGTVSEICGRGLKVEAPCSETAQNICVWKNLSYQALFDEVELFVPVGDLDDYPLVSIVTLLLGCAGCIYILSVLSTTPL